MVSIKVLGTGCRKCQKLYDLVQASLVASGVEATLQKVEKLDEIMGYGVMMTPALVIDEKVLSVGKIPSLDKVVGWLNEASA